MGQLLQAYPLRPPAQSSALTKFCDLQQLPPEVALTVLANLNATDLCLAGCVWKDLADAEMLWRSLCRRSWGFASCYKRPAQSFKKVYMLLDEATLTFNYNCFRGLDYLLNNALLDDTAEDIACFINCTDKLDRRQVKRLLQSRPDVLELLVQYHSFRNQFLPNALRGFFSRLQAPSERGDFLSLLLQLFAKRFIQCNPDSGLSVDTVYVVCFSLIMLSVDLYSPHVKNKMSKREFIRNVRGAAPVDDELAGHLYDNVYLVGHVASRAA